MKTNSFTWVSFTTYRIKVSTFCANGENVVPDLPVVIVPFGRLLKDVPSLVVFLERHIAPSQVVPSLKTLQKVVHIFKIKSKPQ